MKKIVALLLAGIMVLGMSVAAFAADSPSTNGKAVTDQLVKSVSGDLKLAQIEITEDKGHTDAEWLAEAKKLGIDTTNVTVFFNGDIHMTDGSKFKGSVDITFNVTGDKIYVLHDSDGTYENLKVSGTTATFTNFSPFAILVEKTAAKPADSSTSPKTGETPVVAILAAIAVLAGAGVVVSRKRAAQR